jgi:hypothetical protein
MRCPHVPYTPGPAAIVSQPIKQGQGGTARGTACAKWDHLRMDVIFNGKQTECLERFRLKPGVVVYAYNPSYTGGGRKITVQGQSWAKM